MNKRKIAVGSDHRGVEISAHVLDRLRQDGAEVLVYTCPSGESCDYPDNAFRVAQAVSRKEADLGVLICGTGIGMCIAANKVKGVRAALVHDELTAEMSRSHNDANVLCLPADIVGARLIDKILARWLQTPFEGGRHARRVKKIAAIERGEDPATVKE